MRVLRPDLPAGVPASGPATLRLMKPDLGPMADLRPYLDRIGESGVYSNFGPLATEYAARLGERFDTHGAPGQVCLVTSGTTALELALRHRLGAAAQGAPVLVPAYTFVATPHAVRNAGYAPYFVDCDAQSWMVTPAIARAAMAGMAVPPAGIVVVSAFGAPLDLPGWEAFEAETGVAVIYDAAGRTGMENLGAQPVCLSLHATKILGVGEGGAVLSRDEALIGAIARATNFGFEPGAHLSMAEGGNGKLSEFAAAVGLANLGSLPARLAKLQVLSGVYARALEGTGVVMQAGRAEAWVSSTLNLRLPEGRVGACLAALDAQGIPWRRWWGHGCHVHPAFAQMPRGTLDVTGRLAESVIGLPFHTGLDAAEVMHVAAVLRHALG